MDDALGNGVFLGQIRHSVPFLQHDIGDLVNLHIFFFEKLHHILEGQDIVDEVAFLSLAFLGDARTDEDDLGLGMLFLEDFGVGHHWRIDGRQILERHRVILLNHAAYGRTGRRNEVFELSGFQQVGVLLGHRLRPDSRLFRIKKAKFGQREFHHPEVGKSETGNERRGDTGDHLVGTRQQGAHFVDFAVHHLRVLRAHERAVAAQDASVFDNLRLMSLDVNGFHRTFAQAFVAVFTFRIAKL